MSLNTVTFSSGKSSVVIVVDTPVSASFILQTKDLLEKEHKTEFNISMDRDSCTAGALLEKIDDKMVESLYNMIIENGAVACVREIRAKTGASLTEAVLIKKMLATKFEEIMDRDHEQDLRRLESEEGMKS